MIRIGMIGINGRMNKAIIEEINNHPECSFSGSLVYEKDQDTPINQYEDIIELANSSDAIIDFTNPRTSIEIAQKLVNSKVSLVCGTTGFDEQQFKEFKAAARLLTSVWSANMSIGINLLQILLKTASSTLTNDFDSAIIDIHHRHKKDSPSGTALMLAKTIEEKHKQKEVQISSLRIGEVPGEHQVIFSNSNESITISHQAFNRNIFAQGAIKACLWSIDKEKGLYSMQDVLN